MASSSRTSGLCPDWVLSMNSDAHVARDRDWYTTYTPFRSFATTFMAGDQLEVIGVGDVDIPVKLHPGRSGRRAHGRLRLRNVLHVPDAVCNIVGGPHTGDYHGLQLSHLGDNGDDGQITDRNGRRLAYLHRPHSLSLLKLSGRPTGPVVGPSPLKPDGIYMLHAFWPETERARWAAAQLEAAPSGRSPDGEKNWLKQNWGGEYKFLVAHGLSVYDDDDGDEGRRIVRATMKQDLVEDDGHDCGGPFFQESLLRLHWHLERI